MSETNNILVLVLTNGDQILTQLEEQGGAYVCTNVLQIMTRADEATGQVSMGMMPYLPYTTGSIAIPTNMAMLAVPNQDLIDHYKRQFGMIIAPPEQKIFLG